MAPNPGQISKRSEASAYSETTPEQGVCQSCKGPVLVDARYDDFWKTPIPGVPLRITDSTGVVLDGGLSTKSLMSLGGEDGQPGSMAKYPQLGTAAFNAAQRGGVEVALVANDTSSVKDMEAAILKDIEAMTSDMETALKPWWKDWQNRSVFQKASSVISGYWNGITKGFKTWLDGEGDFWAGLWEAIEGIPEWLGEKWDQVSEGAKKLWENRKEIFALLESLTKGLVSQFQQALEKLKKLIDAIPGFEDIKKILAMLVDEGVEWSWAMIEMIRSTRVVEALAVAMLGIFSLTTPNFWAEMYGTGVGFILPEVILAIIFAIIAYFTAGAGAAGIAARITQFTAKVVGWLKKAGKAGKAMLKVFTTLKNLGSKIGALIKKLKNKISEVRQGVTDKWTKITRRAGKRVKTPDNIPCFNKPKGVSDDDFKAQLREQENAINNSDLDELIKRRDLVKSEQAAGHGTSRIRKPYEQTKARKAWLEKRSKEILADAVANNQAMLPSQALKKAKQEAATLDATHVLDIVAGGKADEISKELQSSTVNRSMGKQWTLPQTKGEVSRVDALDAALARQKKAGAVKANVKLNPCKGRK